MPRSLVTGAVKQVRKQRGISRVVAGLTKDAKVVVAGAAKQVREQRGISSIRARKSRPVRARARPRRTEESRMQADGRSDQLRWDPRTWLRSACRGGLPKSVSIGTAVRDRSGTANGDPRT